MQYLSAGCPAHDDAGYSFSRLIHSQQLLLLALLNSFFLGFFVRGIVETHGFQRRQQVSGRVKAHDKPCSGASIVFHIIGRPGGRILSAVTTMRENIRVAPTIIPTMVNSRPVFGAKQFFIALLWRGLCQYTVDHHIHKPGCFSIHDIVS